MGKKVSPLEMIRLLAVEKLEAAKRDAQPSRSRKASARVTVKTATHVKQRDGYRCQYRDPVTGKQCDGRYYLETEHKQPRAKGGSNHIENLESLCSTHNRLRAIEQFGVEKMAEFVPRLS